MWRVWRGASYATHNGALSAAANSTNTLRVAAACNTNKLNRTPSSHTLSSPSHGISLPSYRLFSSVPPFPLPSVTPTVPLAAATATAGVTPTVAPPKAKYAWRAGGPSRLPTLHYPKFRQFAQLRSKAHHVSGGKGMTATMPNGDIDMARWWSESDRHSSPARHILTYFITEPTSVPTFRVIAKKRQSEDPNKKRVKKKRGPQCVNEVSPPPGIIEAISAYPGDIDAQAQFAMDGVYASCRRTLVQLGLWSSLEKFDRQQAASLAESSLSPPATDTSENTGEAGGGSPRRPSKLLRLHNQQWRSETQPTPEQIDQTLAVAQPSWFSIRPTPLPPNCWNEWTFDDWAGLAAAERCVLEGWTDRTKPPILPDLTSPDDIVKQREADERALKSPYTPQGRVAAGLPPLPHSAATFDIAKALMADFTEPTPNQGDKKKGKTQLKEPLGKLIRRKHFVPFSPAPPSDDPPQPFRIENQLRSLSHLPLRSSVTDAPLLFLSGYPSLRTRLRDKLIWLRIAEGSEVQIVRAERQRALVFRVNMPSHGKNMEEEEMENEGQEFDEEEQQQSQPEHHQQQADEELTSSNREGATVDRPDPNDAMPLNGPAPPRPRSYALSQFGTKEYRIDLLFRYLMSEELRLSLIARAYTLELDQRRRLLATEQQHQPQATSKKLKTAGTLSPRQLTIQATRDRLRRESEERRIREESVRSALAVLNPDSELNPSSPGATNNKIRSFKRMSARVDLLVRETSEMYGVDLIEARRMLELTEDRQQAEIEMKQKKETETDETNTTHAETVVDGDLISSTATPVTDNTAVDGDSALASSPSTPVSPSNTAPVIPDSPRSILSSVDDPNLPPSKAPLIATLPRGTTKNYLSSFHICVTNIQSIEEAIRQFVHQKREEGVWDRMVEERIAYWRQRGVEPAELRQRGKLRKVGDPTATTISNRQDTVEEARVEIESMPEHAIDLFLSYRPRPAIPYSLFDDITRMPEEESAALTEADRAEANEEADFIIVRRSGVRTLAMLKQRIASIDTDSEGNTCQTGLFNEPVLSASKKKSILDAQRSFIFNRHLFHLNPSVTAEMERAMRSYEAKQAANADSSQEKSHDNSNYQHFLRPATIRSGLFPLCRSLADCMLPESLRHEPTLIRVFPWLLWDTWRFAIQAAYMRLFPDAFGNTIHSLKSRERQSYAAHAAMEGQSPTGALLGESQSAITAAASGNLAPHPLPGAVSAIPVGSSPDPLISSDLFILKVAAGHAVAELEKRALKARRIRKQPLRRAYNTNAEWVRAKYEWVVDNERLKHRDILARAASSEDRSREVARFDEWVETTRHKFARRIQGAAKQTKREEERKRTDILIEEAVKRDEQERDEEQDKQLQKENTKPSSPPRPNRGGRRTKPRRFYF